MGNKMLIDATHPEETRVVVIRGNRVEEFDYESASRKQLRGSIYLAKVARIEPSLQAAFVNYGGNRHGFLAFSEIHPDYYQIPVADREAVLREEAAERTARIRQEDADFDLDNRSRGGRKSDRSGGRAPQDGESDEPGFPETIGGEGGGESASRHDEPAKDAARSGSSPAVETEGAGHTASASDDDSQSGDDSDAESAVIPLQAVLPPVLYGEFTAALERGEEARDEIPAHDDDAADDVAREASVGEVSSVAVANVAGDTEFPEAVHARQSRPDADDEDNGSGGNGTVIDVRAPAEASAAPVEIVGSEDALEELPQRTKRRWRQYKIQEVIKRNQIVLVQVVKEERGTKGAALTTYLSLAGRYTVLMPNTASGGGISRKITNPVDRKRLKELAHELEVPEGMGLIIRTAGASRTKAEIKRDFEYLLRLWENVRDLTLRSTAPALVYEEGDLIRRSIRDLYNKDIDEVLVAGENAYREAKDFMRMLMPSHAKNVQLYKDPEPVFTRYEVERQLNQMFSPVVTLRSGGYIVLNQTEALVAIDVNSGRATREYSIEDTALKTNLEAAEEIARQVRLRDLAGLIVIDFIDMDERRNNRSVERRLKECLRHDRARIQVGHISHFGLLEMSRQRLRQGVVEVSTVQCPMCQGVGTIRSTESVALMILRAIEDHLRTQGAMNLSALCSVDAALYILNHKRAYLRDIEARYSVSITINADAKMHGAHFSFERGADALPQTPARGAEESRAVHMDWAHTTADEEKEASTPSAAGSQEDRQRRRRRRRGRSRGEGYGEDALANGSLGSLHPSGDEDDDNGAFDDDEARAESYVPGAEAGGDDTAEDGPEDQTGVEAGGESQERGRRSRRRGRRAGRRRRGNGEHAPGDFAQHAPHAEIPGLGEQPAAPYVIGAQPAGAAGEAAGAVAQYAAETAREAEPAIAAQPEAEPSPLVVAAAPEIEPVPAFSVEAAGAIPASQQAAEAVSEPAAPKLEIVASETEEEPKPEAKPAPAAEPQPEPRARRTVVRKGWWQRSLG